MNAINFKDVLWDISDTEISLLPSDFIIKRTLTYGTLPLILKMLKENNKKDVKNIFKNIKESEFNKKKYNYLKNYLFI